MRRLVKHLGRASAAFVGAALVFSASTIAVTAAFAADADFAAPPGYAALTAGAAEEIRAVEDEIDRTEATARGFREIVHA